MDGQRFDSASVKQGQALDPTPLHRLLGRDKKGERNPKAEKYQRDNAYADDRANTFSNAKQQLHVG